MNYLSIAAILKDEEDHLEEWLAFHHLVGVERFYLFDNNSTDRTAEIIHSFPHQEMIRYFPWDLHPGNRAAYQHVIDNFRDETVWCSMLDGDEFLFGTREDDLREVLARYDRDDIGGLTAHWLIFGTSGHKTKPPGLLIENFQHRAPDDFHIHQHPKTILKLKEAVKPVNAHLFETRKAVVNERFETVEPMPLPSEFSHDTIRINHYYCKSEAQWRKKQQRGYVSLTPDDPRFIRPYSHFTIHDRNDVRDTTILRFADELRASLQPSSGKSEPAASPE